MATCKERLLQAMALRGMNQADLSRVSGLSTASINQYVKGVYIPKQKALYKLAVALDVSIPWLMGHDVPMETDSTNQSAISDINFQTEHILKNLAQLNAAGQQQLLDYSDFLVASGKYEKIKTQTSFRFE